jgi:hypothetical protein
MTSEGNNESSGETQVREISSIPVLPPIAKEREKKVEV